MQLVCFMFYPLGGAPGGDAKGCYENQRKLRPVLVPLLWLLLFQQDIMSYFTDCCVEMISDRPVYTFLQDLRKVLLFFDLFVNHLEINSFVFRGRGF